MSRPVAFFACCWQFGVLIFLTGIGIAAVLSMQAVPDILYSSLAITFISRVDDLFWSFMHNTLAMDASFTILHEKGKQHKVPMWADVLLHGSMFLPVSLALYMLMHAWLTNEMPAW